MATLNPSELDQLFGKKFCHFFGHHFVHTHFRVNLTSRSFDKKIVKCVMKEYDIRSALQSTSFWINLTEKLDSKYTVEGRFVKTKLSWQGIARRFFLNIYPNGTSIYKISKDYFQQLKIAIDSIFIENNFNSTSELLKHLFESADNQKDDHDEVIQTQQKHDDDTVVLLTSISNSEEESGNILMSSINNQVKEVNNDAQTNDISHESNDMDQQAGNDSLGMSDEDTIIVYNGDNLNQLLNTATNNSADVIESNNTTEKQNSHLNSTITTTIEAVEENSESEASCEATDIGMANTSASSHNSDLKSRNVATTIEAAEQDLTSQDNFQTINRDNAGTTVLSQNSGLILNAVELDEHMCLENNKETKDKFNSVNVQLPHNSGYIERMDNSESHRKRFKVDTKLNSNEVRKKTVPNIDYANQHDSSLNFIETVLKKSTVNRPITTRNRVKLRQIQTNDPKPTSNINDSVDDDTDIDLPDPVWDTDDDNCSVISNQSTIPYSNFSSKANKYNPDEDQKIVKYIVKKVRFADIKGNQLWKDMELENICPGRTWQSMKERFRKTITPNLSYYCETLSLSDKAVHLLVSNANYSAKSNSQASTKEKVEKKSSVNVYTAEEDKEIVKFILAQNEDNNLTIMGRALWQKLSKYFKKNLNRIRTWQSLKERFIMRILPKIYTFDCAERQNRIIRIIEECSHKLKDSSGLKQKVLEKTNK